MGWFYAYIGIYDTAVREKGNHERYVSLVRGIGNLTKDTYLSWLPLKKVTSHEKHVTSLRGKGNQVTGRNGHEK